VDIRGWITDESSIAKARLGDKDLDVLDNGSFRQSVPVQLGKTELRLTAKDAGGNESEATITIQRVDETPPLLNVPATVETALATAEVVGSVSDDSGPVQLTANGEKVELGADGSFVLRLTDLRFGDRSLNFSASDGSGNKVDGMTLISRVDRTAPVMVIEPMKPTYSEVAFIRGKVTDDAGLVTLTAEGNTVSLQTNGQFEYVRPRLPIGKTPVTFRAADRGGNASTTTISVERVESPEVRLNRALDQYETGDFQSALPVLEEFAKEGKSSATIKVARIYRDGLGTDRNATKSCEFYRMAEKQGSRDAQDEMRAVCVVPPRSKALLIGVANYRAPAGKRAWNTLKNPVRDIDALGKILKEGFGFDVDFIRNPKSRSDVHKALKNLMASSDRYEQILVVWSGHGTFDQTSSVVQLALAESPLNVPESDTGDDGDPSFDTYFKGSELNGLVAGLKSPSAFLMVDACKSGALDTEVALSEMKGKAEQSNPFKPPSTSGATPVKFRLGITSGNDRRSDALDGPVGGHSPFMQGILDYLERLTYSRDSGDAYRLFTSLEASIRTKANVPTPHSYRISGHDGDSQFLFVPKQK
jgi:hypothetical protein